MAKSVTRYDEVGNAVIREARPASNVRTAPRDVKAKGAVAVAAWNKANRPQPGKTGDEAMKVAVRGIMKQAADKRAKKTIASTARSFTGGTLNDALSANNTPKVAADAPLTQKRAAVASGMAARAANRVEAGSSDGGPKRRAAERFARIARGEKPFGGAAVAESKPASTAEAASGAARGRAAAEGKLDKAIEKVRSATPAKAPRSPAAEKAAATRARNREVGLLRSRIDNAKASLSIGKPTPADIDRTNTLIRSLEMQVSKIKSGAAPKAKAKSGRVAGMTADNPFPSAMTRGSRTGTAAQTAQPPSFIDKVNAAAEASAKARKNAPKPPATPPGPRDHWNRIGSPQPTDPAKAYKQKFGYVPPSDMAPDAMQRWINGRVPVAPGRTGDPAYEAVVARYNTMRTKAKVAGMSADKPFPSFVTAGAPKPPVVTNDSAMGMKPPAPPAAPPASARSIPWAKINTGLAVVGTGVAAAQAFKDAKERGASTGGAVVSGAVAATPGMAMTFGGRIGQALVNKGTDLVASGGKIIDNTSALKNFFLADLPWHAGSGRVITGGSMYVAGKALQTVGKVAAPVMAAWGAYQGAKEDDNKVRGAVRGAMRSLDPSAIVTGIGAGTGLMKDGRGLGERAYDAAFGGPTQGRVSAVQAQAFAKADANFDHMGQGQPQATGERPGWSPEARIAAAQARGAVNLPYGGDPTQAPGYQPPTTPKGKRPY